MARTYYPGLWPAGYGAYQVTSQPTYDGGGDDFLPPGAGFLLQEDGFFILQEDGFKIIIEG